MKKIVLAFALLVVACPAFEMNGKNPLTDQKDYPEALFTLGNMATVELEIPEKTWQNIVAKASDKTYHECDITINGERFGHVGVRTKGASSLDDVVIMKSNRYSFTLNLNKFEKGQKYHGLSKLQLNNNIWDATQMKDAIVYDMCRFIGLPAPLANYARIMLNGEFFGCYLLVEPVEKNFCRRNYADKESNIYKPYHN